MKKSRSRSISKKPSGLHRLPMPASATRTGTSVAEDITAILAPRPSVAAASSQREAAPETKRPAAAAARRGTASGYVARHARGTPKAMPVRRFTDPEIVSDLVSRLPVGGTVPEIVVDLLERIIGRSADAHERLEAMIAVSISTGRSVAGAYDIDPEMADELLSRNKDNRTIGVSKMQQSIDDMVEDRWEENGSGVAVSSCGHYNDGQHRALSIRSTGTTQRMNLTVGVTRDSRHTLDIGRTRGTRDHAKLKGIENSSTASALGRAVIAYEHASGNRNGGSTTMGRSADVSTPAILARIKADPAIASAAEWADSSKTLLSNVVPASMAAFVRYILDGISPSRCVLFFEGVLTGAESGRGLPTSDPRWMVRRWLMAPEQKDAKMLRIEMLLHAWNAWCEGTSMHQTPSGILPPVVKPDGR